MLDVVLKFEKNQCALKLKKSSLYDAIRSIGFWVITCFVVLPLYNTTEAFISIEMPLKCRFPALIHMV